MKSGVIFGCFFAVLLVFGFFINTGVSSTLLEQKNGWSFNTSTRDMSPIALPISSGTGFNLTAGQKLSVSWNSVATTISTDAMRFYLLNSYQIGGWRWVHEWYGGQHEATDRGYLETLDNFAKTVNCPINSTDTYYVIFVAVGDYNPISGYGVGVYVSSYAAYLFSPPTVTVTPSNVTMDRGQSQLLTCTVSSGTPPYTYQWYLDEVLVSGATSDTWTFASNSSGIFAVNVNVMDSAGYLVYSNYTLMYVNLPPSVSISPSSVIMDVNQSQLFTSTVSYGTSPYSYQWYLNGAPINGATSSSWVFTPPSQGSYIQIYVKITDNVGVQAISNTATVTVNSGPFVSILPSPSVVMDVGQSQLFTSSVSGGTSPYTYQWHLYAPVSGATSNSWTFTPTSSGSYTVYLSVTDSVGQVGISNTTTVTVGPGPPSSCRMWVEPSVVSVPGVVGYRFNVTVWANVSQPCFAWEVILTFNSTYFAADSAGYTAGGTSAFFSGHYTVPVFLTITSNSVTCGETLLGADSRATGSDSLVWVEFEVKAVSSQSQVLSINNGDTWVLDPDCNTIPATFSDATVNMNAPLSVSILPSPIVVMDVGQSQTFNSAVSGGTGSYSYQWYLNGAPQSGATTAAWTFTPPLPGSYIQIYVKVTDSVGVQATSNTTTVNVNLPPSVSILPSPIVVMDVGQSQLFTSTVSGGTSPYTYQWYLNGAPVSGAIGSSWTFTPASAGPYTVYVEVTDSVGVQATSNTTTVTVNPGTHDVAVTNVASLKTVVGQGFSAFINVTVANQGSYTETFNVTAYANATTIASQNVTLPGGNSTTVTFTWNTTGFAYGNYTLNAYAWPVPGETDTTNNNFTGGKVTVAGIGDLTGGTPNALDFVPDGKVDMRDVGVVARFFGQPVPPAPSNCDITGPTPGLPDGIIDMRDIGFVARHFGDHYP